MKAVVIIPTYNEKENISLIIDTIISFDSKFDILIIDDNSPDGTSFIVKEKQKSIDKLFLIERKGKLGLGTAYIKGFRWAIENNYDFVFEMDADFSHNPEDLIRLQKELIDGKTDVVIGSRYINGVNIINWPMKRLLLSYFASKYVKFITGMNINDATAGFVGYNIKVLKTINLDNIKFIGYAFQIEMKYKLLKLGFRLKEIPIVFTDRERGNSKMTKGIMIEAILGVLKLKFDYITGKLNKKI